MTGQLPGGEQPRGQEPTNNAEWPHDAEPGRAIIRNRGQGLAAHERADIAGDKIQQVK
ncbi:MAG TPA: hypothetical protein VHO91_02865 [Rhodopila sp.]|nr:hypothetical protein [Rhodopila sp.]